MTICPRCNTPRNGARYCPSCGFDYWADAALTTCPRCHAPRSGTLPICPSCGYDYRTTGAATPLTTYPQAGASAAQTHNTSNLRRGALLLAVVLLVVGAGGFFITRQSGVQPGPNVPPAGTIWFGTSFDTTTFEVSGQASSFAQGDRVVMVAHLSRTIPGGQSVNVLLDGVILRSESPTASDYNLYGIALNAAVLPTGTHTFEVEDVGGNTLASGAVTITP